MNLRARLATLTARMEAVKSRPKRRPRPRRIDWIHQLDPDELELFAQWVFDHLDGLPVPRLELHSVGKVLHPDGSCVPIDKQPATSPVVSPPRGDG